MQYRSKQYRTTYSSVFCMAMLLCFFPPTLFTYIPGLSMLVDMAKFAASALALLLVIAHPKPGLGAALGVLFYLSLIASTLLNSESLFTAIKSVFPHLSFLLYADYMLSKRPFIFVRNFANLMKVYIILNLLMLIVLPDGVGKYIPGYNYLGKNSRLSFLALDNNYIKLFIPATVTIYFSSNGRKTQRNFYFLLMLGTIVYVWSGTGLCCLVLLMAYIFLLENTWFDRLIGYYRCCTAAIIAYIGTISSILITLFSALIENTLGKSITLSGRTFLWTQALQLIRQKPVLGYGVLDRSLLFSPSNAHAYSAHNTALQILLLGGVPSLVIFAAFVLLAGMAFRKKASTKESDNYGQGVLCVATLAFLIVGIFEILFFSPLLILMIMLVYHYNDIITAFPLNKNNKMKAGSR